MVRCAVVLFGCIEHVHSSCALGETEPSMSTICCRGSQAHASDGAQNVSAQELDTAASMLTYTSSILSRGKQQLAMRMLNASSIRYSAARLSSSSLSSSLSAVPAAGDATGVVWLMLLSEPLFLTKNERPLKLGLCFPPSAAGGPLLLPDCCDCCVLIRAAGRAWCPILEALYTY